MIKPSLQSSLIKRFTSTVCLLTTLFFSSGGAGFAQSFEAMNLRRHRPPAPDLTGPITITSPKFGSAVSGSMVKISLQVSRQFNPASAKTKLNGKDVSSQVLLTVCNSDYCTLKGNVMEQDGLRSGENRLSVTVKDWDGKGGDLRTTKFHYHSSLLGGVDGSGPDYYEPDTVGISTDINANTGWVTITTGTTANVDDPVSSFPPLTDSSGKTVDTALPYPDTTVGDACSSTLRAVALKRSAPSVLEGTACAANMTDLMSNLGTAIKHTPSSSDLVIVATSPNFSAPSNLDTSALGGSSYASTAANLYPEEYMMIGVPGAAKGSAFENFDVSTGTDTPYQYAPFIKGTLMSDGTNYNYLPSDQREFQLINKVGSSSIQIGGQTYLPPSGADNGAFWLLVVDRELLQPINYSVPGWTNCQYDSGSQTCGGMFDVHADGGAALGNLLQSISSRNMVFLMTQGCPFSTASQVSSSLTYPLANYGGVNRITPDLNSETGIGTCEYTLASVNDMKHTNPLNDKLALSTSQFTQQQQTGSIHGFVARGKDGLYDIGGKDQMVSDGNGGFKGQIDFRFNEIASAQRQDWPYTDTPGHLAAYHDISYQVLTDPSIGGTGSNIYDLRYYYEQGGMPNKFSKLIDSVLANAQPSSWDTQATDFNAVRQQLQSEVRNVNNATEYLAGDNLNGGIRGIITNSQTPLFTNMIGVAAAITADQDNAAQQNMNANLSDMLSMLGGVTGMLSVVPGVGPAFGVISGALTIGATVAASSGNNIPSGENSYDQTLGQVTNDAGTYVTNLLRGFDNAVISIQTDANKLGSVGALTSDSNAHWSASLITADKLNADLVAAASRQVWLDVMPKLYGVRYFFNMQQSNPAKYGSWVYTGSYTPATCESVYSDVDSASWFAFPSSVPNRWDTYILGESPKPGKGGDATVSGTISNILMQPGSWSTTVNSITQNGLNLPQVILFSNSNMTYAPGIYFYPNETCTVN
jgi:hypothetical protein